MVMGEKIRIGYILRKLMQVAYLRAFSSKYEITFDCYMEPGEDKEDEVHKNVVFSINDGADHLSKEEFR
jgi:hypothetical protein